QLGAPPLDVFDAPVTLDDWGTYLGSNGGVLSPCARAADPSHSAVCRSQPFQVSAVPRQKCVPEGVVGLMHDHAGEAAHEKLALAGMRIAICAISSGKPRQMRAPKAGWRMEGRPNRSCSTLPARRPRPRQSWRAGPDLRSALPRGVPRALGAAGHPLSGARSPDRRSGLGWSPSSSPFTSFCMYPGPASL